MGLPSSSLLCTHARISKGYQRMQDWKNTIRHCKKALHHDENFVPCYEVMGEAFMMLGMSPFVLSPLI